MGRQWRRRREEIIDVRVEEEYDPCQSFPLVWYPPRKDSQCSVAHLATLPVKNSGRMVSQLTFALLDPTSGPNCSDVSSRTLAGDVIVWQLGDNTTTTLLNVSMVPPRVSARSTGKHSDGGTTHSARTRSSCRMVSGLTLPLPLARCDPRSLMPVGLTARSQVHPATMKFAFEIQTY
jgi:hypothetical protein